MINKGEKLHGRYVIDDIIGEGGGGIVYIAYDVNLQSHVVVKQIKEDAASFLECRTEADILKGLKHECLPKVLDFFEDNQKVFTVIDYIEGVSLAAALKTEGRFLQKQVLSWARQLAHALAYLHSQKNPIIHSDIKPANIMWNTETDKVCLIDFNISLAFNHRQNSVTWLSGGYSPPEQYQSLDNYCAYLEKTLGNTTKNQQQKSHNAYGGGNLEDSRPTRIFNRSALAALNWIDSRIDERSDVYSFGASTYHLLTGIKPELNFLDIIPISQFDIDLSEGLCHIIEKCMEIDPAKRYQNGMELAEALDHIYELDSEYQRFRKRRFHKKMACLVLLVSGISLMAGGLYVNTREKNAAYQNKVVEAGSLIEQSEYEEAAGLIKEAQKLYENRVEADQLELLLLYRSRAYEECLEKGFLMLKEKHYVLKDEADQKRMGNLYYLMGSACLEMGENGQAVEYFDKALEYERENALFYRDYAIALARGQKTARAEAVLEEAKALGLDQDSLEFIRGEISYAKKDYYNAQSVLLEVIGRTKSREMKERAILLLNRMYIQCGPEYLNTAIAMLEREKEEWEGISAVNLSEALANDYLRRARALNDTNDVVRALNEYISLYNAGQKTLRIMENIGIINRELGKTENAEQMAKQIMDQYPQDYRGHKLLAFLELDKQQKRPNENRNYQNFQICYQNADKLYKKSPEQTDEEMQLLKQMYEELHAGGWY